MKRRDVLTGAVAAGIALHGGETLAKKGRASTAAPHRVKPLPFKPGALRGLSARLLESHHDKNYAGAVRKLNAARAALAELPDSAAGFVRGGLLEKELTFRNSVVLHELYFENLGGRGQPTGRLAAKLSGAFGSLAKLETALQLAALTKAGGSGWAVVSLGLETGAVELTTLAGHAHGPAAAVPLVVLDMYEHSYAIDYGADAKRYVEAFYDNVSWQAVAARLDRAERAHRAWVG